MGDVDNLIMLTSQPLIVKATAHGSRQMCRSDKYGFPCRYVPKDKFVNGFQTGDIVKAVVTSGKKIGEQMGRCTVSTSGLFVLSTPKGLVQGISSKYCQLIHHKDGYGYQFQSQAHMLTAG